MSYTSPINNSEVSNMEDRSESQENMDNLVSLTGSTIANFCVDNHSKFGFETMEIRFTNGRRIIFAPSKKPNRTKYVVSK